MKKKPKSRKISGVLEIDGVQLSLVKIDVGEALILVVELPLADSSQ